MYWTCTGLVLDSELKTLTKLAGGAFTIQQMLEEQGLAWPDAIMLFTDNRATCQSVASPGQNRQSWAAGNTPCIQTASEHFAAEPAKQLRTLCAL